MWTSGKQRAGDWITSVAHVFIIYCCLSNHAWSAWQRQWLPRFCGAEVWVGRSGHGLHLLSNVWDFMWVHIDHLDIEITQELHLNNWLLGWDGIKGPLKDLCSVFLNFWVNWNPLTIPVRKTEVVWPHVAWLVSCIILIPLYWIGQRRPSIIPEPQEGEMSLTS